MMAATARTVGPILLALNSSASGGHQIVERSNVVHIRNSACIVGVYKFNHSQHLFYRAISAVGGGAHAPICCRSDSKLATPQWSVILPFCTRITSMDSK